MSGEPNITVVGNIASDPDLRFSPGGVAVLSFTVASTPRSKDRDTGNWVDGETLWVRVTAFHKDAENGAESLLKGTRVIVTGRLQQESWEDKEGNKRTSLKLLADEIGVSVKWASVKVSKVERGSTAPVRSTPADDPWATSPSSDEAPF